MKSRSRLSTGIALVTLGLVAGGVVLLGILFFSGSLRLPLLPGLAASHTRSLEAAHATHKAVQRQTATAIAVIATAADVRIIPSATAKPTASATATPQADRGIITPTATRTVTASPTETRTSTPSGMAYTVQRGESIGLLADRFGLPVSTLIAANALTDPDLIQPGDTLLIPPTPTEAASATPTIVRTATPTPVPATAAPTSTPTFAADLGIVAPPTVSPWPGTLNGVALSELLIMPPAVRDHVREIYQRGQALGNDPAAFSRLGDSTIENPHFMTRFDDGEYNLGAYDFLQPAIDHFQGSFARDSVAVQRGLNSWVVFDPMWARNEACESGVGPLACEIDLHQPSVIFIRMGTNDRDPASFETNLSEIVTYCIERGVIPLLGTKADRHYDWNNANNAAVRRVAATYNVPLWDFDRLSLTLPNRGLTVDSVHLTTYYSHDYRYSTAFQRGYAMHNLLALMMLERVRQEMEAVEVGSAP
jgi:LysM repeat protein